MFSTALIGQTEKTLNAILARELEGTGLTEPQWVALVLAVEAGAIARDDLTARLAGALRQGDAHAADQLQALGAAGLVGLEGPRAEATDAGRALHDRIRGAVGPIVARLWGDLPEADLEAAGRVLSTVLERARAELAAA